MKTSADDMPDMDSNPPDISRLYHSEAYSDLTIRCSGRDFHVHRAILCIQSTFFENACKKGFKEAEEGVINLEDDDASAVEQMIRFLYLGHYDESVPLLLHAQVYVLAVKYDIKKLLACPMLVEKLLGKDLDDEHFMDTVKYLYTNTHSSERAPFKLAIMIVVHSRFEDLFHGDDEKAKKNMDILEDTSGFAADVALAFYGGWKALGEDTASRDETIKANEQANEQTIKDLKVRYTDLALLAEKQLNVLRGVKHFRCIKCGEDWGFMRYPLLSSGLPKNSTIICPFKGCGSKLLIPMSGAYGGWK